MDTTRPAVRATRWPVAAAAALAVAVSACATGPTPPDPAPTSPSPSGPSSEAAASVQVPGLEMSWAEYLDGVIALLATLHPEGDTVDWEARREALGVAEVDSASDGYLVASHLVRSLGDPTTSFEDAVARRRFATEAATATPAPPAQTDLASGGPLDDGLALLRLPTAVPGAATDGYLGAAWSVLEDGTGACGWVLDVRGTGGDAWTTLQALAPLFGEGTVLRFVGPTRDIDITVDAGRVRFDGRPLTELDRWPLDVPAEAEEVFVSVLPVPPGSYEVSDPPGTYGSVPVAVVHDARTGNAAAIGMVALRGREGRVRTFGERPTVVSSPTAAGLPVVGEVMVLADGSRLHLRTFDLEDRTGATHPEVLDPDVVSDTPLEDARRWLAEQPACGS